MFVRHSITPVTDAGVWGGVKWGVPKSSSPVKNTLDFLMMTIAGYHRRVVTISRMFLLSVYVFSQKITTV